MNGRAIPTADEVAARLTDRADLTATLNLYRANVPPEALLGEPLDAPPVTVPAMGVWSDRDFGAHRSIRCNARSST